MAPVDYLITLVFVVFLLIYASYAYRLILIFSNGKVTANYVLRAYAGSVIGLLVAVALAGENYQYVVWGMATIIMGWLLGIEFANRFLDSMQDFKKRRKSKKK